MHYEVGMYVFIQNMFFGTKIEQKYFFMSSDLTIIGFINDTILILVIVSISFFFPHRNGIFGLLNQPEGLKVYLTHFKVRHVWLVQLNLELQS